jgi:hypothetical protein
LSDQLSDGADEFTQGIAWFGRHETLVDAAISIGCVLANVGLGVAPYEQGVSDVNPPSLDESGFRETLAHTEQLALRMYGSGRQDPNRRHRRPGPCIPACAKAFESGPTCEIRRSGRSATSIGTNPRVFYQKMLGEKGCRVPQSPRYSTAE